MRRRPRTIIPRRYNTGMNVTLYGRGGGESSRDGGAIDEVKGR
jgi:hypothetical protein